MELRRYAAIIRARWLIVAATFVITVLATLALVMPKEWFYQSSGTVQVVPRGDLNREDEARAWGVLNSGPQIATTYATIVKSDLITGRAEASVGDAGSSLRVETQVQIDTSIITVTATAGDPEAAQSLAAATIRAADAYVDLANEMFALTPIDPPDSSSSPAGPNKNLQMSLGIIFGLALGIAVALFAEYVRRPAEDLAITDPATGASNEFYLRHRLREEVARARRTGDPFSVGTLRVEVRTGENDDMAHVPADRDLRRIARGLRLTIPDDAVLAYLGGGSFVALVPGMTRQTAESTLGGWGAAVTALLDWSSQGELGRRLQLTSGVCEFRRDGVSGSAEVKRLVTRLIEDVGSEPEPEPEPEPEVVVETAPKVPKGLPVPKPETPARKPAAGPVPDPEAPATRPPAMPPAPVPTGRSLPGNGAKTKQGPRRVTVVPDVAEEEPGAGPRPPAPQSSAQTPRPSSTQQPRKTTQSSSRAQGRGTASARGAREGKSHAGDGEG